MSPLVRLHVLIVPGTYVCPQNWTFECVDASSETIVGGCADHNGALFYHVEPHCDSLPCPRLRMTNRNS